jgi:Uma2 family endonuclease
MGTTTRTVTYEEWLHMPIVEDAIEEVVNGEVRIMPPNRWKHAVIVENLSDAPANTRRNMADKMRDYESMGVPELWIISPEAQTIEVIHLENGKPITHGVVTQGQLSPRRFPAVEVEVSSIWPD